MAELTSETSLNPAVLRHLLDSWRQQAATAGYHRERDKGTAFERLCMAYLQYDPIQARQYEQPMLYSDWAQAPERRNDRVAEPLGFYAEPERSAQDLGIDLVAKLQNDEAQESGAIEVICLVGTDLSDWENPERRQMSEKSMDARNIRVITYQQLIRDAEASYQQYLEKSKDKGRIKKLLDEIETFDSSTF